MVQILKHPLSYYVEPIIEGKPYSFSRWGDGEWASVLSKRQAPQRNCDGHLFFPDMQKGLQAALRDLTKPVYDYWVGMQPLGYRMWKDRIEQWLKYNKVSCTWHNADIFHHASVKGHLDPLLAALTDANVVVVGPKHLRALDRVFGYNGFVEVPARNCFRDLDEMIHGTEEAIRRAKKPVVVAISASMPAEILIHRLYPKVKYQAFLIDFGSLFDPYVGVNSRRYHRGLKKNGHGVASVPSTKVATGSTKSHSARK